VLVWAARVENACLTLWQVVHEADVPDGVDDEVFDLFWRAKKVRALLERDTREPPRAA
jgi:hypothetical protein